MTLFQGVKSGIEENLPLLKKWTTDVSGGLASQSTFFQ